MKLLVVVIVVAAVLSAGCVAPVLSETCPPRWYSHPPREASWAVGVGHCGKTYYRQESADRALVHAVNQLAAQAGVSVQVDSELLQKLRGGAYSESWTQQIDARVVGVIRGFDIVEQHHCVEDGSHTHTGGSSFVLVRIRRSALADGGQS